MNNREIIAKIDLELIRGSFLSEGSKKYLKVYLPSSAELLSFTSNEGLVEIGHDGIIMSLKTYLTLLMQGKSVDTFFTDDSNKETSEVWSTLQSLRHHFPILTFIEQSLAAANALLVIPRQVKGSATLRETISKINQLDPSQLIKRFVDCCERPTTDTLTFEGIQIEHFTNEIGELMISFIGYTFKSDLQTKLLRDKLRSLEARTGLRSASSDFGKEQMRQVAQVYNDLLCCSQLLKANKSISNNSKDIILNSFTQGNLRLEEMYEIIEDMIVEVINLLKLSPPTGNHRVIEEAYIAIMKGYLKKVVSTFK